MSRTYGGPGDVIDYVAAATHSAGDLIPIGNLIGVVQKNCVSGDTVAVAVSGIHTVTKVTTADCLVNTLLQLDVSQTPDKLEDAAATPATGDITGGALCLVAAGTSDTVVKVLLLPGSGAVT